MHVVFMERVPSDTAGATDTAAHTSTTIPAGLSSGRAVRAQTASWPRWGLGDVPAPRWTPCHTSSQADGGLSRHGIRNREPCPVVTAPSLTGHLT